MRVDRTRQKNGHLRAVVVTYTSRVGVTRALLVLFYSYSTECTLELISRVGRLTFLCASSPRPHASSTGPAQSSSRAPPASTTALTGPGCTSSARTDAICRSDDTVPSSAGCTVAGAGAGPLDSVLMLTACACTFRHTLATQCCRRSRGGSLALYQRYTGLLEGLPWTGCHTNRVHAHPCSVECWAGAVASTSALMPREPMASDPMPPACHGRARAHAAARH